MPKYTFKEGTCAVCGSGYKGLICDEEPHRNECINCRSGVDAVQNAKTLYYKEFIPYWDGSMGVWVTSKGHREREIKERDLVEVGDFNPNYLLEDVAKYKGDPHPAGVMDDEFADVWNEVVVNGHLGDD